MCCHPIRNIIKNQDKIREIKSVSKQFVYSINNKDSYYNIDEKYKKLLSLTDKYIKSLK